MKLWFCLALVLLLTALVASQDAHHRPPNGGPNGRPNGGPNGGPAHGPHGGPGQQHEPQSEAHDPIDPISPEKPSSSSQEESSSSVEITSSSQDSSSSFEVSSSSQESSSGDDTSDDVVICIMMTVQCPDGTFATQNEQCQYICGKAPTGGLSWNSVDKIREEFYVGFQSVIQDTVVTTLKETGMKVKIQSPPESYDDYCIKAYLKNYATAYQLPAVYNGVRVVYVDGGEQCSPQLCPDGTLVGCDQVCPSAEGIMVWPITIVFCIVVMATCMCCCVSRKRSQKACKKAEQSALYPAVQYESLQQQFVPVEEVSVPMMAPPVMMYPPMPPVPPHMMMNGQYPIMMQGPNGMWYPVIPQHFEEPSN